MGCGAAACAYRYTELSGSNASDLKQREKFPDAPDGMYALTEATGSFALPRWDDNYGVMLEGFVRAPVSGNYSFRTGATIEGGVDDSAEVWVSSEANRVGGKMVKAGGSALVSWTEGESYYVQGYKQAGVDSEPFQIGMKAEEYENRRKGERWMIDG